MKRQTVGLKIRRYPSYWKFFEKNIFLMLISGYVRLSKGQKIPERLEIGNLSEIKII